MLFLEAQSNVCFFSFPNKSLADYYYKSLLLEVGRVTAVFCKWIWLMQLYLTDTLLIFELLNIKPDFIKYLSIGSNKFLIYNEVFWALVIYSCWSVQLSSVTQSCPTLCNPMDCSTAGFPDLHQHPELAQTHDHQVSDAIKWSHPLSSPSPPAFNLSQHQGLFQWVSFLHQMAKVLEFQLQHQSFQWIFRIDFL